MPDTHVPVVVVGAGAAGLASSILLSRLGIEHLLFERHPDTSNLPKAHVINQRTMEIFREAGLADRVYRAGAPAENMTKVAWFTSFAGPTPLHGREIGYVDAMGGGDDAERYEAASPCRLTNLAQSYLEPIMRDYARELAPDRQRFSQELVALVQDEECVRATIRDVGSGSELRVSCDYLIGADGGRSVGAMLGIEMVGERDLATMVSVHFSADLSDSLPDPGALIMRFVNPDGSERLALGALAQMGGDGWGAHCSEWMFNYRLHPDQDDQLDPERATRGLREMLGLPDLEIVIHSISTWTVEGVVADRFQEGRVFLVGDAAHRRPPAGGLGLNNSVQDAHNLAWKIAYVLRGIASSDLVDTYAEERRPVDFFNTNLALKSHFESHNVEQPLGIRPDSTPEEAWAAIAAYFSDGPEAQDIRDAVKAAIAKKRNAYGALNVELGFHYDAGALVPEPDAAQAADESRDTVVDYVPTTRSGHRVPHAWLRDGTSRLSTIDLPQGHRFVLILDAEGEAAWEPAIEHARQGFPDVDLEVAVVGRDYLDPDGVWAQVREVGPSGAVLVRPDGIVGWRSHAEPGSADVLVDALGRCLRSSAASKVPA